MKHGTKPTRAEKKIIAGWGLLPENWLVIKHTAYFLQICHRHSEKTVREIPLTDREEDNA